MKQDALNHFIKELSKIWGPLNSDLTKKSKELLQELTINSTGENWVDNLIKEQLPFKEIYRSEEHGFILMGHIENKGDISPPHDHGSGWVIYSVVQGQSKMGLFNHLLHPNGSTKLVQKDSFVQKAGQCSVYLPGDIHDTHTLEDNTLMFRLTSCDFFQEIEEGRLVRYTNEIDKW